MSNLKVDVCVVGAGPSGTLLAYLLAKKELSVLLIEKSEKIGKFFRGEHVNEDGEEILKKHHLFDGVEQLGLLRMKHIEYWHNGEIFKAIDPDPSIGHLSIHVPQANLLTAILKEAQKLSNFHLLLNTTVSDLVQDKSGRYVAVKTKHGEEVQMVEANLIIGADGRYSTIRKKAELDSMTRKHGFDLLWARIPAPANWSPSIKNASIDDLQLAVYSQANNFIQIGWNIKEGSYPTLHRQPISPFIDKLIEAFPELEETVRNNIQSWHDFVLLDVFSSISEEWGKEGLLCIGDAVHTMTPTGGYGLNCALKDADVLADLLHKENIADVDFTDFITERKKEAKKLLASQIEMEQTFLENFAVLS
ncbi:FAD-dependent monooxygenase [Rummeliibacillus pycnus]|uniref:FAD-dependent monooxygenase n=1 Tax=Rummeliibacillus pycnus TaxID=101070 RepID=UPI000C997E1C|nr:FAD-dependent monooxygenase [Rummeliibacillus pycnus]